MGRPYRLGRRQAAVDRTAALIVAAARELTASGAPVTLSALSRRAGVARATVYNRFGGRGGVLAALAPRGVGAAAGAAADSPAGLREAFHRAAVAWAADPALYRYLRPDSDGEGPRTLAERLAAADALRPGCSLKEAEDVIATLMSFPVFDRLHRDGRRTPAAVAEILWRLAGGILA